MSVALIGRAAQWWTGFLCVLDDLPLPESIWRAKEASMRRALAVMLLCVALLLATLLCPWFVSGSVVQARRGDVNGDGVIDLFDLVIIASAYNPNGPVSDPRADINGDGVVKLFDLVLAATSFESSVSPVPTPTAPTDFRLVSRETSEENDALKFNMEICVPHLEGPTDAQVQPFNRAVHAFVAEQIRLYRPLEGGEHLAWSPPSSLRIRYTVVTMAKGVLSVLFDVDTYGEGAAHSLSHAFTINYDLDAAKLLALPDLFKPL